MSPTLPPAAQAAIEYNARGWRAIRLYGLTPEGRCTCKQGINPSHQSQAGKHPTDVGWQDASPLSPEQVEQAWAGWRANSNVGIATGRDSGFFVLDVDPDKGGFESVRRLQEDHGTLPATVTQRTGSGGYHLLFKMPEDFEPTNRYGGLTAYPGLDVRGTGGQIVVEPSVSGKGAYTFLSEPGAEPEPAPEWLLDMLRPKEPTTPAPAAPMPLPEDISDVEQARLERYAATVREREVARLRDLHPQPAGRDRHGYRGAPWISTTFQVSAALLELGNSAWTAYSKEQAYADVFQAAPRDDGFTDEEVNKHFRGAAGRIGDNPRAYPVERPTASSIVAEWMTEPGVQVDRALFSESEPPPPGVTLAADTTSPSIWPRRERSDLGNAKRMVDHFGARLRWVHDAQKWAEYRDGVWTLVQPQAVQRYVQDLFDGLIENTEALEYSDLGDEDEPSEREQFLKWVRAQGMHARISAAQAQAQGRAELQCSLRDFDLDPLLLNVRNGVVDLRTGTLQPHDARLMLSRQVDVDFDPAAEAPLWHAFLDRVQPDPDMQAYLQRILGYTLTGSIREQCFFTHTGDGANGKSIMAWVVSKIMGSYGGSVAPTVLLEARDEQHPTGWADMAGRRFLPAQETSPGKRLDESKIKEFTGGQEVKARFIAKDYFNYVPVGKIHLITNHLPILSGDPSIWRRVHLVRWDVTIPEHEQDKELASKLETELPGILAWVVRGCLDWQGSGIPIPAAAQRALQDWRGDSDSFGEFIETCTMPAPGAKSTTTALYNAYTGWAFRQGLRKPMTQQSFVQAMVERKFERYREARGRGFKDIAPIIVTAPVPWEENAA